MSNLRTKTISFLLIIFSYELSYGQLTLEDIFLNRKYEPEVMVDISFFKNEAKYATLEKYKDDQQIVIFNPKAQRADSILLYWFGLDEYFPRPKYESVESSNTDKYFLLKANEERLYRRAGAADYFMIDKKRMITQIGNAKISFPAFSTDDKKIAYVKDNNLFWFDIAGGTEQQATIDGKWNSIINGKSDWVYEEEFSLTNAFVWCDNSSKIAYLKFDETDVKEYTFPNYYGQAYPNNFSYKYPKAGKKNSMVTAHYYDCKKRKNYKISLSKYQYEYIPKITAGNDAVYFTLLNRHQDTLKVVAHNFETKQTKLIFQDVSRKYIEVPKIFYLLKDNTFITESMRDGFNHLYLFDENGNPLKQLTKGNFEITDIYGIDEKNKLIYYQSNENNEIETAVFSLNYETLEKKKLTSKNGLNTAVFSNDFSFFIHTFSDVITPPNMSVRSADVSFSFLIEDNKDLQASLSDIPQKEFIKIPINDHQLNAWLIKPKDLDQTKKYPLLMYVYGGPNSQEVQNEWQRSRDLFFNYMAEQGYVTACVDNRGTDGRGAAFKQCTFLNLGKIETDDQLAAANYFGNLPFIDKNRIGIFGWSYGGYLSLLSILQKNTPFKTAVAVAPVTNWKFYDNIYTERYMHTPEENRQGYEQFNPIALAKNLSRNLLLIHGTADDNVHFQHSIEFINALNEANKTYQLYIYPDKAHSIAGVQTRYDLFSKIAQYLKEKL